VAAHDVHEQQPRPRRVPYRPLEQVGAQIEHELRLTHAPSPRCLPYLPDSSSRSHLPELETS